MPWSRSRCQSCTPARVSVPPDHFGARNQRAALARAEKVRHFESGFGRMTKLNARALGSSLRAEQRWQVAGLRRAVQRSWELAAKLEECHRVDHIVSRGVGCGVHAGRAQAKKCSRGVEKLGHLNFL